MLQKGKERNEIEVEEQFNTIFNLFLWSTYMPHATLKVKGERGRAYPLGGGNPTSSDCWRVILSLELFTLRLKILALMLNGSWFCFCFWNCSFFNPEIGKIYFKPMFTPTPHQHLIWGCGVKQKNFPVYLFCCNFLIPDEPVTIHSLNPAPIPPQVTKVQVFFWNPQNRRQKKTCTFIFLHVIFYMYIKNM